LPANFCHARVKVCRDLGLGEGSSITAAMTGADVAALDDAAITSPTVFARVSPQDRTRRIPFFRSHPSLPLTLAPLGAVAVGSVLPATPLAHSLGFSPLPVAFFAALAGMVVGYLALVEAGKRIFTAPPG
jgi:hypothetical protein